MVLIKAQHNVIIREVNMRSVHIRCTSDGNNSSYNITDHKQIELKSKRLFVTDLAKYIANRHDTR